MHKISASILINLFLIGNFACTPITNQYKLIKLDIKNIQGIRIYHLANRYVTGMNNMNNTSYKSGGYLVNMINQENNNKFSNIFISSRELIDDVLNSERFKETNSILFSNAINGYNQREINDRKNLFEYCKQNNIKIYLLIVNNDLSRSEYQLVQWE